MSVNIGKSPLRWQTSPSTAHDLWNKLTSGGGEESMCGWLKDKFGLSWQIIPTALAKLGRDKDPEKAQRVWQAMLKMRKIDFKALRKAYDGK